MPTCAQLLPLDRTGRPLAVAPRATWPAAASSGGLPERQYHPQDRSPLARVGCTVAAAFAERPVCRTRRPPRAAAQPGFSGESIRPRLVADLGAQRRWMQTARELSR